MHLWTLVLTCCSTWRGATLEYGATSRDSDTCHRLQMGAKAAGMVELSMPSVKMSLRFPATPVDSHVHFFHILPACGVTLPPRRWHVPPAPAA